MKLFARVLLALALVPPVLRAQIPNDIITDKGVIYRQSSATAQTVFEANYQISVSFPTSVATTTQVQLRGPVTVDLARVTATQYERLGKFPNITQRDAALPDGTYTLVVSGGGVTSNTPLPISTSPPLNPPAITNYDELQSITSGTFRVAWQPITLSAANHLLYLQISRDGMSTPLNTDPGIYRNLNARSTSAMIDNFSLLPGETVDVILGCGRLRNSDANNGFTLIAAFTSFGVRFTVKRTLLAPSIVSIQPQSLTLFAGNVATFTVNASGTNLTYQWRRDGAPIPGATRATLTVASVQPADAGRYTVEVRNSVGTVTSDGAVLTVLSASQAGRIINLSVLTSLDRADDTFTVGFVIGGNGTSGQKPLLVRAGGPSLASFAVALPNADPKLELWSVGARAGENDNWAGIAATSATMAQVGAFTFLSGDSKDAALVASVQKGDNSMIISANGGATGAVIAELYDATPTAAITATTPRLVNVSVLKNIPAGTTISAGFVIGGATDKTVLIRAVGPSLTAFGVSPTHADPALALYRSGTAAPIAANDNWAGTAELASAFAAVGAFALPPSSKDAALVVTLQPGSYTAQVTGVAGSTGLALVEVYEVP